MLRPGRLRSLQVLLLLLLLLLPHQVLLMGEKLVLFLCVENAGRSLIAEAMFNADPPPGWRATSAGTRPAASASPRTRAMLAEVGLVPPEHPPQELTNDLMDRARVRVTMGCLDDTSCPAYLQVTEVRDWRLADPVTLDDAGFRRVRDQIAKLVRDLRTELVISDRNMVGIARS